MNEKVKPAVWKCLIITTAQRSQPRSSLGTIKRSISFYRNIRDVQPRLIFEGSQGPESDSSLVFVSLNIYIGI